MTDLRKTAETDKIVEQAIQGHSSTRDAIRWAITQKREWAGLTHEERDEIDQNCRSQMEALFAVEAKLKEKNT